MSPPTPPPLVPVDGVPPEEENLAPNLAPNPEPLSYKQGKRLWGKRAKAVKVKTVERLSAAAKAAEDVEGKMQEEARGF